MSSTACANPSRRAPGAGRAPEQPLEGGTGCQIDGRHGASGSYLLAFRHFSRCAEAARRGAGPVASCPGSVRTGHSRANMAAERRHEGDKMMKRYTVIALAVGGFLLSGCANMNRTEQSMV